MPPPPVMPATRDYPRGRGRTRATARKTTGLPSRRHLLPGEGTSNAAQPHGLPDAMRYQLQENFVPRGEFHTWSCSYKTFASCKPKDFYGTEGATGVLRWIEKMEVVLSISECLNTQKVKYATCSFQNKALTWWNTQVQARGRETIETMSWSELKALLIREYCPKNEMQKMEEEFWNLRMDGAGHQTYTNRFHELCCLLPHMVSTEEKKVDRYIWGLSPQIRGMVTAAEPRTLEKAILLAGSLTDEMVRTGVLVRKQKRKRFESKKSEAGTSRDSKQVRSYAALTTEKKGMHLLQETGSYGGIL
ncbi:hypothetical protein E3N88_08809 [Mikania micrantha]|uniref:Ty3 transposon capsid-like protein domain-containing protein n=1 Tax=Mikania micrantha TaxID=192012 RepID=A0A5N6PJK4_9ASTR|nr:hypothetical protein E3N88_08809 [Mikania micrantha]